MNQRHRGILEQGRFWCGVWVPRSGTSGRVSSRHRLEYQTVAPRASRYGKSGVALALTVIAACGLATAATPEPPPSVLTTRPGWFPFPIPWDDAAPGTTTDVSALNDVRPAGAHGRIVTRDGHFVESSTGRRVRFIGLNLPAESAFPSHDDADKIAAALSKYGINVVRLHHMDNSWGRPGVSLIEQKRPDTMHFNAAALERLDYLVAALARQGIYSNINLKVSHAWTMADGAPAEAKDSPWSFDKRVDTFDPKLIELQKDFARQLLTHVNPFTKLSYVDDPAVAFVEINNENSLLGGPMEPLGRQLLGRLAEPYRGELAAQWNAWLKKTYKTDAALAAAWKTDVDPPTGPLLNQRSTWSIEHQGKSNATLAVGELQESKSLAFAAPVELNVTAVDDPEWYVQAHLTGLSLEDSKTYTLRFRAKADAPRSIGVSAGLDQADWHNIGLNESPALTTEWKTFTYVFDCADPVPQHARIAWVIGGATGKVWLDQVSLEGGAAGVGLLPGESLESMNLKLPPQMSRPQYADFVHFLADTERSYADTMRNFLRRDLGVRANITDTQIDYGGLTGIEREAGSDFADAHAYWQHPSFPRKEWDSRDWTIANTPLINTFAGDGRGGIVGGTLGALAMTRVAGRPFTVSEYDHPAPSDYVAEMIPMLATFAAAQDWDAVYLFALGPYGAASAKPGGGDEKINGFFDTWNHPSVRAMLPAAALIFRNGQFAPIPSTLTLQLPPRAYATTPFAPTAWKAAAGDGASLLTRRLSITQNDQLTAPAVTGGDELRFTSDAIHVQKSAGGAVWLANSMSIAVAAGFITGDPITCGPMRLQLTGGRFGAVALAALDGKAINESSRLLLTITAAAENPGIQWNASRTSIANHWGRGPVLAQHLSGTAAVACGGKSVLAYPLDRSGARGEAIAIPPDAAGIATLRLDASTLWYELAVTR